MRDGTFALPEGWSITFMFLFVSLSGWFGFKVLLCLLGSVGLHTTEPTTESALENHFTLEALGWRVWMNRRS